MGETEKATQRAIFLEIFRDIKSKAINVANTSDYLALLDKFPKINLADFLQFEMYKRVIEVYNLAQPLLKQYGIKIEPPELDPAKMTVVESMKAIQGVLDKIYSVMMELDLLPKPRKPISPEKAIDMEREMFR